MEILRDNFIQDQSKLTPETDITALITGLKMKLICDGKESHHIQRVFF